MRAGGRGQRAPTVLGPTCRTERPPKTPNRVVGSGFRSKHRRATVFVGREESSGKSRLDIRAG
jgi:hypothetical protein